MEIGNFTIWMTAARAKEIGCTHRGRFMGIIPGFIDPDRVLWVSRSDLLNPIEDLLAVIWATMRELRGEEPDFMFEVGAEI